MYIYIHAFLHVLSRDKIIDITSTPDPFSHFHLNLRVRTNERRRAVEKDLVEILKNIGVARYTPFNLPRESPEKSWLFFKPKCKGPDPSRKTRRSNASSPEEFRKNGNDKRATLDDFLTLEI